LRIPQFVIGVASSGYRSANPRFAPAINRSASPSDQPATRAACQSPALPSNSTSNSHRLPGSPVGSPASLQLAPSTRRAAQPSGRSFDSRLRICPQPRLSVPLATRAACRSSSLPSDLPPSSRLLALRPAPPSYQSPACAFNRSSGPAFEPNLRLSSVAASFGFAFVPTLQLAPPVNLPAVPSSQLPARAFCQPSSSAFEPARSLHRLPVPGSAFVPISGLRLPSTFRPTDCACLQLAPSTPLFGSAFRFASSLRRLPTFQPCHQTQPPTLIECLILRLASVRLQLAPSTNLAQPSGRSFDLRLRICPQAPPFDQPATRAAC